MRGGHHPTADGASLYWEEEGDGPRVLLVHGGTGTSAFDWEFVREPLAKRFRLLLTDVRGHGQSSDPQYRLSIEQIGDDVASLLEHEGECDAIIAFSVSATAVLALLCRRPSLARAFICIGASTTGDPTGSYYRQGRKYPVRWPGRPLTPWKPLTKRGCIPP